MVEKPTSSVIILGDSTTRLPTDITEYLHINVDLHFTLAELICYAQSYACCKKRSACISN